MSHLNLYYRAFKEYRKHTLASKTCLKQRQQIKQSAKGDDLLETIRNTCIIDKAWVEQIEEGLPFVEKAIAEERQFIKNEGDVVEIEKIKRVSKESVEHLARHSDLITHLPEEGQEIVPDKIFMVERLSDYAVYENRFLYMLLCYLRDFIDLRLKKIKELGNKYQSNTEIKRNIHTQDGKIVFEAKYHEESRKDPYSNFDRDTIKTIERIESCQHVITSLLAKPLMVIVSKSPMIKPPITKTNVLRMNTKFKNSVALYEYISSYSGLGYSIEEIKKSYNSFPDNIEDEFAEIINLTSFLSYEYGNDLTKQLQEDFEAEELEKKEQERKNLLKRIDDLKTRFENGECSIEDYVMELENGNKVLLEENQKHLEIIEAHNKLTEKYRVLKEEVIHTNKKLTECENEMIRQQGLIDNFDAKYDCDMALAEKKRLEDLQNQASEFTLKEQEMKALYEKELSSQKSEYETKISEQQATFTANYQELESKYDVVSKDRDLLKSQMIAVRKLENEAIEDNYNDKQSFEQLEKEFIAFYDFFESKWTDARRNIRQDLLWNKIKNIRKKI